jgi:hypothetical protein
MMLYKIILFLFILGSVSTGLNASGIFPAQMPVQSTATINQAQITDLTNSTKGPVSPLSVISIGMLFVGSILGGLLAVVFVVPLMLAYGIPMYIALMFQGPLWIVEAFGVYQIVTGIRVED